MALRHGIGSGLYPSQGRHTAAAAQKGADVVAKGADVSSLGAVDLQGGLVSFKSQQLDGKNRDAPCLPFHLLPLAGQLIELLASHLNGGVHGRNLLQLSHEVG